MKKRTISTIILMALIIATFSIFAMPASADADITYEPEIIVPGDTINAYERYGEFLITVPSSSLEYDFPLNIFSDYHIIQTFGGAKSTQISIFDASDTSTSLISVDDTNTKGYSNNSFIHYDFSNNDYILRVKGSRTIRLSITRAMEVPAVYGTLPMNRFEDIVVAQSLTQRFYATSPAVVFRYIPDETRTRTIALSGSSTIRIYLMDPSSKTGFDEIIISGAGTYTTPTLYEGRPYYVVMYQPIGPNGDLPAIDVDYIEGTVSIW